MTVIIFFKEKAGVRYGLPSFQKTLTGEAVSDNPKTISVIPSRCRLNRVKIISKNDILNIDYF